MTNTCFYKEESLDTLVIITITLNMMSSILVVGMNNTLKAYCYLFATPLIFLIFLIE
jgi:hypothetical protein